MILFLIGITAFVSMRLEYENKTLRDLLRNGWKRYIGGRKNEVYSSLREALPEFQKVF